MGTAGPDHEDEVPYRYLNAEHRCACGRTHRVPTRVLRLEAGLLADLPRHLAALDPGRKVHVVTHVPAWRSLGFDLVRALEAAGFQVTATSFEEPVLVPDEAAVDRLGRGCPGGRPLLLAVGSGVVHDLTRNLAHRRNLDFDSVPTAPSMDGYASGVSPLVVAGFKETRPGKPPRAIWGDLDVLAAAPAPMIAAGVGDLMAKVIGLGDWELGALLTGEPHCPFIADLMDRAWGRVRPLLGEIREARPGAIKVLMESLVLSGMGMVMAGNSRPASGAEHHLSHFWEMRALAQGHEPRLHGLKVAVATLLVAREVRRLRSRLEGPWRPSPASGQTDRLKADLARVYGPLVGPVLGESFSEGALAVAPLTLETHREAVRKILDRVPSPREIRGWLDAAGLSGRPGSLGISRRDVRQALRFAPYLRNRYTVLRLRDQAPRSLPWRAWFRSGASGTPRGSNRRSV